MDSHIGESASCEDSIAPAGVWPWSDSGFPVQIPEGARIAPESLIPRLGEYLVERGLLKPSELARGLAYQKEKISRGEPVLIGHALVELGLIDRAALDEAITEQIFRLQQALQQSNHELEKRVEQRTADLQQALNKLVELNQLKSDFISTVSHELRTPLTHIKGYLDILADQSLGPITPRQSEAIQVLRRAEMRLENLIDDLIQFSLASRGEWDLHFDAVPIAELLESVHARSLPKAALKGISVELLVPDRLPRVRADMEKIARAINQLLDNAIKFTPSGGIIRIEAQCDNGGVQVAIQDNGIGIPEERLNEIFEPFHQLEGSAARHYSGTGLGLAMVTRVLEAHGSHMQVISAVGEGSRFEFWLPAAR